MRFADADEFFKSFLEPFPVDEFFRTAAGGTDANDTVIGNAVETVAPRLGRSPADVVDNCMTANHTIPIAESSHTVHIPQLQWQGKILIERKIGSNDAGEVAQYLVSVTAAKPNALKRVKISIVFIYLVHCFIVKK